MVVRDEDLRPAEEPAEVRWDEAALVVVVLGVVRLEHPEPVADRDARGDDEEPLRVAGVGRGGDLVEGLPRDEHRHDDRLARPGRHLECNPRESTVVLGVLVVQVRSPVLERRHPGDSPAADLGQEDRRLGRLALGKEDPVVTVRVGPVEEQLEARGRRTLVSALAPHLDVVSDAVDERVSLDLLVEERQRQLVTGIRRRRGAVLCLLAPPLADRCDWYERLAGPSSLDDLAGWALRADLEVPRRRIIGAVKHRIVERDP